MMTILPQNSTLSRANSVTVDAELLAKLNSITDLALRIKLGEVMGKLANSYNNNIINEQKYTLGQALEVIEMAAAELSVFCEAHLEPEEEYDPKHFKPGDEQNEEISSAQPREVAKEQKPLTVEERKKMLFKSFTKKR